jgi:hypothetical protein
MLARFLAPFGLASRRLRARPLSAAAVAFALGGAAALIGWSSLAAALAQEENVRFRLRELPPDERSIQVAYHLVPFESRIGSRGLDPKETAVSVLLSELADVREAAHRVQIWQPVETGVRLVVSGDPADDVAVASGRLPSRCTRPVCEALALGSDFRPGDRVSLGRRANVLVVGRGTLRPEAFPTGPSALPSIPDPGDRALLVPSVGKPLAPLLTASGSSVVTTAPLDPDALHGSELRSVAGRVRSAIVRVDRGEALVDAGAPLELLDDIADRGEVARQRLFLIAGQGAALIVVFAAFAASARRDEALLLGDQLETLGASRTQVRGTRLVEALVPGLAGALVALAGLRLGAQLVAERRGLPSGFVASALPFDTLLTIAAVTAVGALVLAGSRAPGRRSRVGIGALEVAAVTALAFVAWQAATTGGLDPERIAAGQGAGPVLLLLPALAFFATGVLLLRILPLTLRLAERLARRAPLGARLGLLTAARRPGQVAAATSFLAVALGSALFSLNYEDTLERQARDEARFTTGARWRVVERSTQESSGSSDVTPLTRFARASAERPSPVLRFDARLRERFASGASLSLEVLALPSTLIPSLLGWRETFSGFTPAAIAASLRPRAVRLRGTALAPDVRTLRVWARGQAGRPPRLAVLHFLLPDEQRFAQLRMGVITPGWSRVSVRVPAALRGAELVGLEFPSTFLPPSGRDPGGFVELGRMEQRRPGRWSTVLSFDGWTAATPAGAIAQGSVIAAPFSKGAPVGHGIHVELTSSVLPLIRPVMGLPAALPALASGTIASSAVDGTVTVDLLGRQLRLRVVGRAQLFPTVLEQPTSFVVLDYDTLFAALNVDRPGFSLPSEAWFFKPQRADFAERLEAAPFRLESAVGVEPLTNRLLNDPLAAGTRDVLGLAAVAAAVLAALGLLLAARSTLGSERLLLAEYEAMGVPPATLARSMQARLLVLSALGVAAGFVGALLAVRMVGAFVAVTGTSARPLPPIQPVVAWSGIAIVLAAVVAAGLASAAFLAGQTLRETAARRLRA